MSSPMLCSCMIGCLSQIVDFSQAQPYHPSHRALNRCLLAHSQLVSQGSRAKSKFKGLLFLQSCKSVCYVLCVISKSGFRTRYGGPCP